MNRPRHSLLSLFDPLTVPQTPLRDENHSDPDKENFTPFSALFTRSINHNPSTPVNPLRKRLVDIGDATLDDTAILDLLTEEQEPPSASVTCLETPVPPFQRRTPLRLPLGDANPTPIVRFKPHSSPFLLSQATPHAINANETNTPEILVSSCHSLDNQPSQHATDLDSSLTLPHPPQADFPFQGDTQSTTRLSVPSIASHRLSIDLQASFQIHFQSNSSFDLLNDNISLPEPMESPLADDENFDFELERENLREAMAKFNKEFTPSKRSILSGRSRSQDDPTLSPKQIPEAMSDPAPDADPQHEPWDDTLQSPTSPRGNSQDLPTSPLDDKSSKRQSIPSKLPSPTAHRSPINSFPIPSEEVQSVIPQAKQRRLSTPLVTPRRAPSVAAPPAIQALRIVKRTMTHHPKAESADDASLRAAPHERPYSSSIPSKQATGEETAPSARSGRSMHQSILAKPVASSSTSFTKTAFGPRRVTVPESPVENTASKSNLASQPIASGPKRMPISNAGSTIPPFKSSTSLKQPTRLESSLPITSNLPRPSGLTTRMSVSKLPALSGTSRLRRPAGNLPRRVVAGE